MQKSVLILIFLIIYICCNAQKEYDLKIPDQVVVSKTSSYLQFPGTRVFVDKPRGYELVKQLIRLQKNDNTFLQVIESPVTNFNNQKQSIIRGFSDAVKSGKLSKEYYKKEFKINNYNAIVYYGADNKPNLEQIVLCFGDNDFAVMVLGEIPSNDNVSRDEILKAMLSLYLDKNIKADASILANYSIDLSNSEFKYSGNISQIYYYTIDGKGDYANNPYENQIMIMTLPQMNSEQGIKNYAIEMIGRYKQTGMIIPSFDQKEVFINGNYAYEISFNGSFNGRQNSVYQLVVGNANSAVLFLGGVYDKQDVLMPQIKKIAQTLKLK